MNLRDRMIIYVELVSVLNPRLPITCSRFPEEFGHWICPELRWPAIVALKLHFESTSKLRSWKEFQHHKLTINDQDSQCRVASNSGCSILAFVSPLGCMHDVLLRRGIGIRAREGLMISIISFQQPIWINLVTTGHRDCHLATLFLFSVRVLLLKSRSACVQSTFLQVFNSLHTTQIYTGPGVADIISALTT